MWPPFPGSFTIANAAMTPAIARTGIPHDDGVESKPRSGGRSLYTYTWIWWMSSRKPQPASETITPIAAAKTSSTTKLRLRRIAAGSGPAAGATASGVPAMAGTLRNSGSETKDPIAGQVSWVSRVRLTGRSVGHYRPISAAAHAWPIASWVAAGGSVPASGAARRHTLYRVHHQAVVAAPTGISIHRTNALYKSTAAATDAGLPPMLISTAAVPASAKPTPPGVNGIRLSALPTAYAANVPNGERCELRTSRQSHSNAA